MIGDIKLYGINISALAITYVESYNEKLQTILLLATIFYTFLNIFTKLRNGKD